MKKKEEVFPVPQAEVQVEPKRRGRPPKVRQMETDVPVAAEHVLMTVSAAEEKLRRLQRDYSQAENDLSRLQKEHARMLQKCNNIKMLLASYYNLEEKGTDKILVPERKTPYWYVRATFGNIYFNVVECEWIGGLSDKFRYCRGNFFLDRQTAEKVCDACNALMARI